MLYPDGILRAVKCNTPATGVAWASGDFYISEFKEAAGIWSGLARDVHFELSRLPGAELESIDYADQIKILEPPNSKEGAPRKYDWQRASVHVQGIDLEDIGLNGLS